MQHVRRFYLFVPAIGHLVAVVAMLICGQAFAQQDARGVPLSPWREAVNCGPNCLYIFLQSHGVDVALADVRDEIELTFRGCSMADLENASEHLGMPTKIIKTDVDGLASVELPAIILLDGLDEHTGHFTAAFEINDEGVVMMDPVSAIVTQVELGTFQRVWSGYALVSSKQTIAQTLLSVAQWSLLACLIVFGISVLSSRLAKQVWSRRSSEEKPPAST